MYNDRSKRNEPYTKSFQELISEKVDRKIKAGQPKQRSILSWLGMFGMVGWAVAIPTIFGVLLGQWLDNKWPQADISWTLILLIGGLVLGCINAFVWVKKEYKN